MKQTQKNGANSIAWFKIAECVLRGEKERALGVYRLLAHSIENQPLAMQLEGDIFLACNDLEKAISSYYQAYARYKSIKKYEQAAGLLHHILLLSPHSFDLYVELAYLYLDAQCEDKAIMAAVFYAKNAKQTVTDVNVQAAIKDFCNLLSQAGKIKYAEMVADIDFKYNMSISE